MAKSSIHFKPCRMNLSEAHNERKVKLDYVLDGRQGRNDTWKAESISDRLQKINSFYVEKVGQKMQATAVAIREAVVNIKQETQIHQLRELGDRLRERFGIDCFQIHIHRDEGHIASHAEAALEETTIAGSEHINYHAHMVFAWQNQETGRALRLNKQDMRDIQTLTAETLAMERGQENSKAVRLEAKEYKKFAELHTAKKAEIVNEIKALEEKKKSLNNEVNTLSNECSISEKLIEKKLEFTRKLEQLPFQKWRIFCPDVELKTGKDGSIYFSSERGIARLKDMKPEKQMEVKSILESVKKQQPKIGGMKI